MKKPAGKSGKHKHLADDDHDLWHHTAKSIAPLKRAKDRHHPAAERAAEASPKTLTKVAHGAKAAVVKHQPHTAKAPSAVAKPKPPPPIAAFDRKKVRKIRSGQVEIEARIDLHGMRQDEAHAALIGFLHRCQAKGQRWVLVITGKGKIMPHADDGPFDMTAPRERGVLKRNVPRWLDMADLRPLVVSYTTAAIHHGGEGALYIHLRKA